MMRPARNLPRNLIRSGRLGGVDSSVRSADESEIALFWENGPWGVTPPGHFIYIAMQLLQERGLSFIELGARLRADWHDSMRRIHQCLGQQVPL